MEKEYKTVHELGTENQNTEYKRIWKDEYLKWVCGFANAHGGRIYIGIDDDLSVYGVTRLHKQLEDIPNKIVSLIGIMPETNHIVIDNKDVIEIIIEPCGMPVSYKGTYWYRSGATKQELRGVALHQFLLRKMGLNWEDIPCNGATINDIDEKAVAYFIDKAKEVNRIGLNVTDLSDIEHILSNLALISDGVPRMPQFCYLVKTRKTDL